MYAIVRTGGKQYRVEAGRAVTVERLPAEEGATVELVDVLMIADDGQVTVGTPFIEGARVMAEVETHGRAKKIIVFKYKAKVRTRKKTGHRQSFTKLAVREILRPGEKSKLEVEKPTPRRRRKAEEAAAEEPVAEAETPSAEAVEVEGAEAAPEVIEEAPKRRTRKKAVEEEAPATAEGPAEAPKRRTRRKPEASAEETPAADAEAKPVRRRTPRKKPEETTE
ncbi:MAG: 50S ribosomal protein L21 [Dehalococcoidia bacterium]